MIVKQHVLSLPKSAVLYLRMLLLLLWTYCHVDKMSRSLTNRAGKEREKKRKPHLSEKMAAEKLIRDCGRPSNSQRKNACIGHFFLFMKKLPSEKQKKMINNS